MSANCAVYFGILQRIFVGVLDDIFQFHISKMEQEDLPDQEVKTRQGAIEEIIKVGSCKFPEALYLEFLMPNRTDLVILMYCCHPFLPICCAFDFLLNDMCFLVVRSLWLI